MLGVAGDTLDAMMRASTGARSPSADVVINVPLEEYGSLDWRRAAELIDEGYRAAEAMRDQLLPLAVSEAEFEAWRRARQARRRTDAAGAGVHRARGLRDERREAAECAARPARRRAARYRARSSRTSPIVAGLDRYETVTWRMVRDAARGYGLRVRGRAKPYAPAVHDAGREPREHDVERLPHHRDRALSRLRHRRIGLGAARSTAPLVPIRALASELYRPIGPTPLFVAPYAGVGTATFNFIDDDAVIARYRQTVARVGLNVGVNLGARSDVRVGAYVGRTTASIDGGGSRISGIARARRRAPRSCGAWTRRTARSCPAAGCCPRCGCRASSTAPTSRVHGQTFDFDPSLTQLSAVGESILERRSAQSRVRVRRLRHVVRRRCRCRPTSSRSGTPFRLGAYRRGRAQRAALLRRDRRLPAAGRPAAGLHGRAGLRGRLARKRRRVRRMVACGLANERRRRARDGYARRSGHPRRFVGLRRPLAHVPRAWDGRFR